MPAPPADPRPAPEPAGRGPPTAEGEDLSGPPVLVAGGTGFLGAAFVRALADRGRSVSVLARDPAKVADRFPNRFIEARPGDVTRPDSLAPALRGIGTLVVAVQFSGFPVERPNRGLGFMEVDSAGTRNLVDAARRAGVEKLVYLSGVGADASSSRPWFRAKGLAERSVSTSGLPFTILRPSWVYGPEDRSLNRFAGILRLNPCFFPQLGDGSQSLNPVFVEDVAEVLLRVAGPGVADGGVFEIGGPEVYTMDEIVRLLMEALGCHRPILHVPLGLAQVGAALLEIAPGRVVSRDAVRFVCQSAVADIRPLRHRFPDLRLTPMPAALRTYLRR
ncbi:MAG: SDR family oxidoreductase [Gemmatimonadota bacterium]